MDEHMLERFRARARRVTLPGGVRAAVLAEATTTDDGRESRPRRVAQEGGAGRPVTRRVVVATGLGLVGSAAALLVLSVVARPRQGESSTAGQGNFFALAAYAEGVDEGDGTHLAAGKLLGGMFGWSGGPDSNYLTVSTVLDLECTGSNVKTLTYSLEGDNVLTNQGYRTMGDLYGHQGVWIWWSEGVVDSYTVDYEDQASDAEGAHKYGVYASVPLDEEMRAILVEMQEFHDAVSMEGEPTEEQLQTQAELSDQGTLHAVELFTEELCRATLVMKAAFYDGTTQIKRYSFSPRKGYAEAYANYLKDLSSADSSRAQVLRENPPSLYLITEK